MIWLSLFIPFIYGCIYFIWYKGKKGGFHKIELREGLCIFLVPSSLIALIVGAMYIVMISNNTDDIEYLSYHYTKIRHEDAWNERVWVTKYRTVKDADGNTHEESYQVQETKYHPEKWYGYLNDNSQHQLYSNEYDIIRKLWNVSGKHIDMYRDYYTIDGDAQEYVWDNRKETIKTYVVAHHYTNKIIGSQSTFKYNEIKPEEAKELGLYEYPSIENHEQNPIIGYTKFVKKDEINKLKTLNAFYGYKKQVTFYLLIFPNTSASIVEDQRSYWQGGNKNEFVVCVGIDSLTNKVQWSQCFSWLDDITMEVECRNFINKQNIFDINSLGDWLENNLHLWKRKEFNDFGYINTDLTHNQEIAILLTVIILSLITYTYLFLFNR